MTACEWIWGRMRDTMTCAKKTNVSEVIKQRESADNAQVTRSKARALRVTRRLTLPIEVYGEYGELLAEKDDAEVIVESRPGADGPHYLPNTTMIARRTGRIRFLVIAGLCLDAGQLRCDYLNVTRGTEMIFTPDQDLPVPETVVLEA